MKIANKYYSKVKAHFHSQMKPALPCILLLSSPWASALPLPKVTFYIGFFFYVLADFDDDGYDYKMFSLLYHL